MTKCLVMILLAVLMDSAFADSVYVTYTGRDNFGNIQPPDVAKSSAISKHKIIRGFSETEVRESLGEPTRINSNGERTQWVYENGGTWHRDTRETIYVYFVNGYVQ